MSQEGPKRIFVLGGDAHFSYLMRRYIRHSAHQLDFGNDFEDLKKAVEETQPALIIIEIRTPDNTEWQTVRSIKSCPETKDIPILVCSWQDDLDRSHQAGAECHLKMPIMYQDFIETLKKIGVSI